MRTIFFFFFNVRFAHISLEFHFFFFLTIPNFWLFSTLQFIFMPASSLYFFALYLMLFFSISAQINSTYQHTLRSISFSRAFMVWGSIYKTKQIKHTFYFFSWRVNVPVEWRKREVRVLVERDTSLDSEP